MMRKIAIIFAMLASVAVMSYALTVESVTVPYFPGAYVRYVDALWSPYDVSMSYVNDDAMINVWSVSDMDLDAPGMDIVIHVLMAGDTVPIGAKPIGSVGDLTVFYSLIGGSLGNFR